MKLQPETSVGVGPAAPDELDVGLAPPLTVVVLPELDPGRHW
jgi:hypothetical protein